MQIDIEKYSQMQLASVGKIYSPLMFLREQRTSDNPKKTRTVILCPDIYVPGKMEVDIVEANALTKGYAVIPESGLNIVYLTSILNTAVSWTFMTEGNLEKRSSITIKKLGNVLIRILPAREQQSVAYLHYLIMSINNQKKAGDNNVYLNYWMSVYEQLLNAIALELVMPKVFEDYEIELLESWCTLISKCSAECPDYDWKKWQGYLGNELLSPQNIVTGNMNKLRVVMNSVVEQMKSKI